MPGVPKLPNNGRNKSPLSLFYVSYCSNPTCPAFFGAWILSLPMTSELGFCNCLCMYVNLPRSRPVLADLCSDFYFILDPINNPWSERCALPIAGHIATHSHTHTHGALLLRFTKKGFDRAETTEKTVYQRAQCRIRKWHLKRPEIWCRTVAQKVEQAKGETLSAGWGFLLKCLD